MRPRAVFDCMVFLQGAGRPRGPAAACLRLVDEGQVTLCVSTEILDEIRDVLSRPKTRQRFPELSPEWAESFLQSVTSKAVLLAEVPRLVEFERDPKDRPYLDLAIAASAQYLVSRDLDLLDLMEDESFRQRHSALVIIDPVAFLKEVARRQPPDAGGR